MRVLGISCFTHQAAAALIVDGQVAAAATEERFTRQRGGPPIPRPSHQLLYGGLLYPG